MKKIIIAGIMLMTVPFVSFAQTGSVPTVPATGTITITNPGLLPGDFFYFLDRWSEMLNIAVTFNKENKARKYLEHAKERVSEMRDVLKDKSAKLDDIADAKADFDEDVADAKALVKEAKDDGKDVENLARELDDELDQSREDLEDILKDHRDEYSRAEAEIRAKIASLSPTDPQIKGLNQALESIIKEKNEASSQKNDLDDNEDLFENEMGSEVSAKKHIAGAVRYKAHLEGKFGPLSTGVTATFTELLKKANEALVKGNFEVAKNLAKQAKKALEKAEESIEKVNDEMKNELENEREAHGELNMGMPIIGGNDVDEMEVHSIEEAIKKSEKMIEGASVGESSNEQNELNR